MDTLQIAEAFSQEPVLGLSNSESTKTDTKDLQMTAKDICLWQAIAQAQAPKDAAQPETERQKESLDASGRSIIVARSVNSIAEVFNPNGNVTRVECFWVNDEDDTTYCGSSSNTHKLDLSPRYLMKMLKKVPPEAVYPKVPNGLDLKTWADWVHIKRPKIGYYQEYSELGVPHLIPDMIASEVQALEFLRAQSFWHPNIVRYHGCIIRDGRVTGIVLDRLPATLSQRVGTNPQDFDIKSCMEKLTNAVEYLHSLGRAHNDINPHNIMVTDHDEPVLIDLESCLPLGAETTCGGTPGWVDKNYKTVSTKRHNEVALRKVREWMVARCG